MLLRISMGENLIVSVRTFNAFIIGLPAASSRGRRSFLHFRVHGRLCFRTFVRKQFSPLSPRHGRLISA